MHLPAGRSESPYLGYRTGLDRNLTLGPTCRHAPCLQNFYTLSSSSGCSEIVTFRSISCSRWSETIPCRSWPVIARTCPTVCVFSQRLAAHASGKCPHKVQSKYLAWPARHFDEGPHFRVWKFCADAIWSTQNRCGLLESGLSNSIVWTWAGKLLPKARGVDQFEVARNV